MRFWVIGNIAIDERLSVSPWPEPGTSVHARAGARDLGGKGANQAIVTARCGGRVELVAAVGTDDVGDWALAVLADEGLSTGHVLQTSFPTDRTIVLLREGGENAVVTTTECVDAIEPWLVQTALAQASPADILLLQGNLGLASTRAALEAARNRGMATALNPSPLRDGFSGLLPLVNLLIVNRHEATALSGCDNPEVAAETLKDQGSGTVVVTLGEDGVIADTPAGLLRIAARPVAVTDTTGAGDTFAGVLVALWANDRTVTDRALEKASEAAAITVSRPGTRSAFPTRAELNAILAGAPDMLFTGQD